MKTEIEKTRIDEIKELHQEIGGYLKMTLDKAIRVGELLLIQKENLKHGEWLPWIKENLPFSERLARDYMRFYDRREELKTANLADLTEARKLLTAPLKNAFAEADLLKLIDYTIIMTEKANEAIKQLRDYDAGKRDDFPDHIGIPDGFWGRFKELIKETKDFDILGKGIDALSAFQNDICTYNLMLHRHIGLILKEAAKLLPDLTDDEIYDLCIKHTDKLLVLLSERGKGA